MHHTDLAVYRNLQGRLYRTAEIIDGVATALRLFDAEEPMVRRVDGTIFVLVDDSWQSLDNIHLVLTAAGQTLGKLLHMVEASDRHLET
ncbi:MAG: hypothetical protein OXJ55_01115 [Caldilineaceae bacterium]|nr:hypothetical protein [Caldilineaceae bacterium]